VQETVGPVSTCERELLRGWWRSIGLMMSFMSFTVSYVPSRTHTTPVTQS
jgi:hypothetical protein